MVVILYGFQDLIPKLLEAGADPNFTKTKYPLLYYVIEKNSYRCLPDLIGSGLDLRRKYAVNDVWV